MKKHEVEVPICRYGPFAGGTLLPPFLIGNKPICSGLQFDLRVERITRCFLYSREEDDERRESGDFNHHARTASPGANT